MNDTTIIRKLAKRYAEHALSGRNAEKLRLMRDINGLRRARPAVYIHEAPWHEMNINGELDIKCETEACRAFEVWLRRDLFMLKRFPGDMPVTPVVMVPKCVRSTGIGLTVSEDVIANDPNNRIVAHRYHDQLATDADIARIQTPVITHDAEESARRLAFASELFDNILPAKLHGYNPGFAPWDDISRYRSVDAMLLDLAERPAHMHKIMARLTEVHGAVFTQYEALGVLQNPMYIHCTAGQCDELAPYDEPAPTTRQLWGRGAAQPLSVVSPEMHDEFDIAYQMRHMERFGLVYYGCCEPLSDRIDKVAKIPNLRKISITPWADVGQAAEAIGRKYVLAHKPNPAFVAEPTFDAPRVRKEIRAVLDACAKNNCVCEFVLKDISTCAYNPENIFQWEKTVMETVANY